MESYIKGATLGEGTFATVFKAAHKETGEQYAIKKIHITDSKEGIHVTALREMKLLREIDHPNVIRLVDVFTLKKNIALVLEFMTGDLEEVIKDRSLVLSQANIKSYMQQILSALDACHSRWIVHRDIKPNNCLLARDGTLKLADFGLARQLMSPERDPGRPYTGQVFARWYRAPELFFGATSYGFGVDVWAAGCILAELLLRRPWFPGNSDIDQLGRVFQALGTPTEAVWPGVTQLPAYFEFQPVTAPSLRSQFPTASDECLDLLAQCMSLDPRKRPTAAQALKHSWFSSAPLPTHPSQLPRPQKKAQEHQANTPPPLFNMDALGTPLDEKKPGGQAAGAAGGTVKEEGKGKREATDFDGPFARPAKRVRAGEASGHASPGMAPDAAGKFSPRPGQTVRS